MVLRRLQHPASQINYGRMARSSIIHQYNSNWVSWKEQYLNPLQTPPNPSPPQREVHTSNFTRMCSSRVILMIAPSWRHTWFPMRKLFVWSVAMTTPYCIVVMNCLVHQSQEHHLESNSQVPGPQNCFTKILSCFLRKIHYQNPNLNIVTFKEHF